MARYNSSGNYCYYYDVYVECLGSIAYGYFVYTDRREYGCAYYDAILAAGKGH